jgi:zinc transport system substrate-binding protein/iron/zinc/copper transport system substrate-binding protein
MLKTRGFLVTAVLTLFVVSGFGTSMASAQTVVASTSLTGALARAAGASSVRILTPADVKHPPEYELRPSDLAKFEGAQVVVYAGYERMVQKLVEVSKNKSMTVVQVDTTTTPDNFVNQARKIAAALRTEKEEQTWEKGFLEKLSSLKPRLAPYAGKKAVVHLHAQGFARWAGLEIVQVIMPGEISPRAIADAVAKRPDIVIDILHMPVAKTIADNARCRYAQLINFPGAGGTTTLEDIFEYDTTQVAKAFQQ